MTLFFLRKPIPVLEAPVMNSSQLRCHRAAPRTNCFLPGGMPGNPADVSNPICILTSAAIPRKRRSRCSININWLACLVDWPLTPCYTLQSTDCIFISAFPKQWRQMTRLQPYHMTGESPLAALISTAPASPKKASRRRSINGLLITFPSLMFKPVLSPLCRPRNQLGRL